MDYAGSQNRKIAKSQNRKIAKSQNRKIAKSQNRKIAKSQNRKIATALLASTAIIFTPSIFAFSFSDSSVIIPQSKPNNEVTVSGGLAISSLSNGNQNVVIDNDPVFGTTNTYDTQKSTQVNGMLGVAYSRLFHFNHDMSVTIGPALYYTNLDDVSGIEHPSTNYAPDFDTLNYAYSAQSISLMAESRAVYEKYNWQPFVTVGIGPSWNMLYDYSERPTDPSSSAMAAPEVFRNNTNAQFAYEAGLGIQRLFPANEKHHLTYRLALSYRYFNFGSGELEAASTQTTNQAIKVNTLNTQAVLLSLGTVF